MELKEIIEELRKLGYDRDDDFTSILQHKTLVEQDYANKTLNHMIMISCKLEKAKFDYAAATGAIFKECIFEECSMFQPDFEFCSFYNCSMHSNIPVVSSFDNCNFINVNFEGIVFESCTFTGSFFENCIFSNVTIKSSTLENALFKDCSFLDTNLRHINMYYVYLEQPKMNNTILPFSQIPYIFGCFQYLMSTSDIVLISSGSVDIIDKQEYLDNAIPLLIQYWIEKSGGRSEFYFPLSNYYIAKKDYVNAMTYLPKGVQAAVVAHDFRMIKFYCSLISRSDLFNLDVLHKFYNMIKRFGSLGINEITVTRSFIRNISEIKSILFHSSKKATLNILYKTNLFSSDIEKVSLILERLFSIAKMKDLETPNEVEITLSENSPLLIFLKISGEEEYIIFLLPILLKVAEIPQDKINEYAPTFSKTQTLLPSTFHHTVEQVNKLHAVFRENDFNLQISEYFLENCPTAMTQQIRPFYYSFEKGKQFLLN